MDTARIVKKAVIAFVLTAGSLPILFLIGINFKSHRAAGNAAKERKLLHAAGIPLTSAELVRTPPFTNADNAAPLYVKMTQIFTAKEAQLKALEQNATKLIGLKPDFSPANIAAARKLLALTKPELDLIEQAVQKPNCDFKRSFANGMAIPFPELAQMRCAVRLLVLQAALLQQEGKLAEALNQIAKGTQIARHCGQDRFMLAMLDRAWHRWVNRYGTDSASLAKAVKVNEQFGDLPDWRSTLLSELIIGNVTIEQIRKGQINSNTLADELAPQFADIYEEYWLEFWRKGFAAVDKAKSDPKAMQSALETVYKAQHQTAKYDKLGYMMNDIMLPVMISSGKKVVFVQAMRRMRTLKIELLKYRLAHNAFPDNLQSFEQTTATDPFDGKPLRYRREGKGFRLWSVGENLKDDGGQRQVGDNKNADVVTFYHP